MSAANAMSKGIAIGNHIIPNRVFLAPMAGVTDLPFRQLSRSLGAGMVVGEMASSSPQLRHTRKSLLRGVHLDEPEPRSVQIVGWDPQTMADAARYNVDQGASIIDINMGCPAKKVCNRLAGSALLGDEPRVRKILEAVVSAVEVPVTLKIRTGTDSGNRNAVSIACLAENSGIALVAVHGRTRADRFNGSAEYQTIREVKANVAIPVIANGDIINLTQARKVIEYTSADGIMIGRGANGAPWLPGMIAAGLATGTEIPEPALDAQAEIVAQHLEMLYAFYGEFQGVRIARKHIKWYTQTIPGSRQWRESLNKVECAMTQKALVQEFYGEQCTLVSLSDRRAA